MKVNFIKEIISIKQFLRLKFTSMSEIYVFFALVA